MSVKTWQQLMDLKNENQQMNWAERMERIVESENLLAFNISYYMDQNLVSLQIYKWFQKHDNGMKSLKLFIFAYFSKLNISNIVNRWASVRIYKGCVLFKQKCR